MISQNIAFPDLDLVIGYNLSIRGISFLNCNIQNIAKYRKISHYFAKYRIISRNIASCRKIFLSLTRNKGYKLTLRGMSIL